MVQKVRVEDTVAWCKTYSPHDTWRRLLSRVWNGLIGLFGITPLRAPPRHAGRVARQLEQRRIEELVQRGVRVPRIVGEADRLLLLEDMGPTLTRVVRRMDDKSMIDGLIMRVIDALVDVHRNGAYLGQAVSRNIVVCGDAIGFIDFEEDPLEIMDLVDAQARDWLMLTADLGDWYVDRPQVLTPMLRAGLKRVDPDVEAAVADAGARLILLEKLKHLPLQSAHALAVAVHALRGIRAVWLIPLLLGLDFVIDGDSDILGTLYGIW